MGDKKHENILRQGVEVWNKWRISNRTTIPDLSKISIDGMDFKGIDFTEANLSHAKFRNLDLRKADLFNSNCSFTTIVDSLLQGGSIIETVFYNSFLENVNFEDSIASFTIFANLDLSAVIGLESIRHWSPSTVGIDTIYKSKGKIPRAFLHGCGVDDIFIDYIPSLISSGIEFFSCFISHSSKDAEFCKQLYDSLQANKVRCWYAPEDLKPGDHFIKRIDESISFHDKLLLVLSENSVNSAWVEKEVKRALAREKKEKRQVLFPVRIDDAVMEMNIGWPRELRESRHIGDFRKWKEHAEYDTSLKRVLKDLRATTIAQP